MPINNKAKVEHLTAEFLHSFTQEFKTYLLDNDWIITNIKPKHYWVKLDDFAVQSQFIPPIFLMQKGNLICCFFASFQVVFFRISQLDDIENNLILYNTDFIADTNDFEKILEDSHKLNKLL
jgi:hypothetical protein